MSAKNSKKTQKPKKIHAEKSRIPLFSPSTQTVQFTCSIIIQEMSVKLRNERQFNLNKKIEMLFCDDIGA